MNTKDKILEAARLLFIKHGLDGVKMQMVADEAGVNKGLLHYYYKSKGKIFAEVFSRVTGELIQNMKSVFSDEALSLDDKISRIVNAYFKHFSKSRLLLVFFISEMNHDPGILKRLGFSQKIKALLSSAQPAMPTDKPPEFAIHFMVTLISLSAFPFMVSPLINEITENRQQTEALLLDRKELVKNTLKNMIK